MGTVDAVADDLYVHELSVISFCTVRFALLPGYSGYLKNLLHVVLPLAVQLIAECCRHSTKMTAIG